MVIQRLDCCTLSWLCCTLLKTDTRGISSCSRLTIIANFFVMFQLPHFFSMVRKVVGMAVEKMEEEIKPSAVAGTLAFENDTIYPVIIVDHNGTRTLDPGQSQDKYLVNGFSVDLTLKLSNTNEAKKNFPAK